MTDSNASRRARHRSRNSRGVSLPAEKSAAAEKNGMGCSVVIASLRDPRETRELCLISAGRPRRPRGPVYQATAFAESGGLMAWAPDLKEQFRVAARNVDKILKGTKAGDIPIQYPPRYYLTISTRTAADLGLTFPETQIAEADQVLR